jgi:alanine dehydrogenase
MKLLEMINEYNALVKEKTELEKDLHLFNGSETTKQLVEKKITELTKEIETRENQDWILMSIHNSALEYARQEKQSDPSTW